MENKKQVIKQAFEEIGIPFNENVIYDNGWLKIKPAQYQSKYHLLDILKLTSHVHSIRPKSLSGIENNNGWVKIESKQDLPSKDFGSCFIFRNNEVIFGGFRRYSDDTFWFFNSKGEGISDMAITHYKLVEFPEKPIY